jgi:hypothetical protein
MKTDTEVRKKAHKNVGNKKPAEAGWFFLRGRDYSFIS